MPPRTLSRSHSEGGLLTLEGSKFPRSPQYTWSKPVLFGVEARKQFVKNALKRNDLEELREAMEKALPKNEQHEVLDTAMVKKIAQKIRTIHTARIDDAISKGDLEGLQKAMEAVKKEMCTVVPTKRAEAALEVMRCEALLQDLKQKTAGDERALEAHREFLRKALLKALSAGLPNHSKILEKGYTALEEEGAQALHAAISTEEVEALSQAVSDGQSEAMKSRLLPLAEATLVRKEQQILKDLELGIRSGKIAMLEPAVNEGMRIESRIKEKDEKMLQRAKILLRDEKKKVEVMENLKAITEKGGHTGRLLGELRLAVAQMKAVGADTSPNVDEASVARCNAALAKAEGRLRSALLAAVKGRSFNVLHKVIEEAEAANMEGAPEEEHLDLVASAKLTIEQEERKARAREGLHAAINSRLVEDLEAAMHEGEACDVQRGPYAEQGLFQQAVVCHAEEKRKKDAREALHASAKSRNIDELQRALTTGVKSEIDVGPFAEEGLELLRSAQVALSEEVRKVKARGMLEAATKKRHIDDLHSCLAEAKAAGVESLDSDLLASAEAVKAEEIQKTVARKDLSASVESRDISMLRKAISEAKNADVETGPHVVEGLLSSAERALAEEENRELARSKLQAAVDSRKMDELKMAISVGEAVDVEQGPYAEPELLPTARSLLREEEKKKECRAYIHAAIEERQIEMLQEAIAMGQQRDVETGPYVQPGLVQKSKRVLAEEEGKAQLREELRSQIIERVPQRLEQCISESHQAKIQEGPYAVEGLLQHAEAVLEIEKLRIEAEKAEELARLELEKAEELARLELEKQKELAKEALREKLRRAMGKNDIQHLEDCIFEARRAKIQEGPHVVEGLLQQADDVLKTEKKKMLAMEAVRKATRSRQLDELGKALSEAEELNCASHPKMSEELSQAYEVQQQQREEEERQRQEEERRRQERKLEEERQSERRKKEEAACAGLSAAIQHRNISGLRKALSAAGDLSLQSAEEGFDLKAALLKAAKCTLEAEELAVIRQFEDARDSKSLSALKKALQNGKAVGMQHWPSRKHGQLIAKAEADIHTEEQKLQVAEDLLKVLESSNAEDLLAGLQEGQKADIDTGLSDGSAVLRERLAEVQAAYDQELLKQKAAMFFTSATTSLAFRSWVLYCERKKKAAAVKLQSAHRGRMVRKRVSEAKAKASPNKVPEAEMNKGPETRTKPGHVSPPLAR
eukprot:TRINITY_DN5875_c0_g1_i1.p1 TRINITY_DN5875_c0_g1~~TRINITY_DN5875_c0_g1_i1.p1  ORF type:complete len:1213 (-),score=389.13 TRINITY_DN5875_c0_g1_i1:18-3656(-)